MNLMHDVIFFCCINGFNVVLDMPKRPPWKYSMSKEQVERSEQEMFENFLDKIYDEYKLSELSYFERNLEVT